MRRSSPRSSLRGSLWVIVILIGSQALLRPARARDAMDDLAAESWGRMLSQSIEEGTQAYEEIVAYCGKESPSIAAAREKFKQAADGEATDAAWKDLEALLRKKELGYFMLATMQGIDKPPASEMFRKSGSFSVLALSGGIDGGIPGQAREAFLRTVNDMRSELKKMGCAVEGVDALLFVPKQFYEAKEKCSEQWSAYESRRERLEYQQAGKPMPAISDPRGFVIQDLQSQKDLSLEEASNEYDALAAAVGEETMRQTVEAVAASPQDYRGHLTAEGLAKLGLISSTDVPKDRQIVGGKTEDGKTVVWGDRPMSALRGLWTRDNPRLDAMFAVADQWSIGYASASQRLQKIEAAMDKERLESALKEFHSTPRQAGNGWLVTPIPPGDQVWMYRPFEKLQALLLAGDDAKAQVRYFIAIDPGTSDAAAVDRKYQELAKLKGEEELLASAGKLRAVEWKPRAAGVATSSVVRALEKMLGLKGEANPRYLQWAGFGPGTTATYEIELNGSRAGMHRGPLYKKREVRVFAATKDGVTLAVSDSEQQRDGSWKASLPKMENIPAYIEPHPVFADTFREAMPLVPGGWLGFEPIGPEIDRQESAKLILNNEVIECTRSVWAGQGGRAAVRSVGEVSGLQVLMARNEGAVYSNSNAPGWVLKAMRATPTGVTLIRMTAFNAKPAAQELAATVSEGSKSVAWLHPSHRVEAASIDAEALEKLDAGSRTWVAAPVGTSVTHLFHYKGRGRQQTTAEEEYDARVVTTLTHNDHDVARIQSIWQEGDDQKRVDVEVGLAMPKSDYVGLMTTWVGSHRTRAGSLDLSEETASPVTVGIGGRSEKAVEYHHVPLPGWQGYRIEQLILSESIPGAIAYLSVRTDPGVPAPLAMTYAVEGLDAKTLPALPELVIKPKGGDYAVGQELMVEGRPGRWEKAKILRFTQRKNDGGGMYLIELPRYKVQHDDEWLREHSRPLTAEDEAAAAASGDGKPAQPQPQSRQPSTKPASDGAKKADSDGGSFAIGSKVQFKSGGTMLEGTVTRVIGEGTAREFVEIEYQDPRRNRTRRTAVRASDVHPLTESK